MLSMYCSTRMLFSPPFVMGSAEESDCSSGSFVSPLRVTEYSRILSLCCTGKDSLQCSVCNGNAQESEYVVAIQSSVRGQGCSGMQSM